jgi:hypothetical protein
MLASLKPTACCLANGLPKAMRSDAYLRAQSNAPCAIPSASAPIETRPPSSVFMNVLKPSPSGPSRWLRGMRASSKTRLAQSEPRIPSFFSPGSSENPAVSRGTTKALMPRAPWSRSVTAVTMNVPA